MTTSPVRSRYKRAKHSSNKTLVWGTVVADDRWQRLQDLFERAAALSGRERELFLEQECGGDRALRHEVEALLDADREETGAIPGVTSIRDLLDGDRKLEGDVIHSWRLIRRIGAGGMGSVFLAERTDGSFEQTVALKIVKRGMDTESVLRRFRMERQILDAFVTLGGTDHAVAFDVFSPSEAIPAIGDMIAGLLLGEE